MSTSWHYRPLDQRGSLNLPAEIKKEADLAPGRFVYVRNIKGCIVIIPHSPEAATAHQSGTLDALIASRLSAPVTSEPPRPQLGKTALAEIARIQRARERHTQRMAEINARLEADRIRRDTRITVARAKIDAEEAERQALVDHVMAHANANAGKIDPVAIFRDLQQEQQPVELPQANIT